jgi:hypothetical protein
LHRKTHTLSVSLDLLEAMFSRHVARLVTPRLGSFGRIKASKQPSAMALAQIRNMCVTNNDVVTIEEAKTMSRSYRTFPNDVLLTAAIMGDQEAREERLIREIMAVDGVSWHDAQPRFDEIEAANRRGLFMSTLPYKMGVFTALLFGFGSIPMIFELNTALWFNEAYVTTDVPEARDLETPLEVGSWTWNWMEPPLGQMSFFILCLQYARSQLQNMGARPYTQWYLKKRAERLANEFPQYSPHILDAYSEGDPLSPPSNESRTV